MTTGVKWLAGEDQAGGCPNCTHSAADKGGGVQTIKNDCWKFAVRGEWLRVAEEKEWLTGRQPLTGGTTSFVRGQGR